MSVIPVFLILSILGSGLLFGPGLIAAIIAHRKGYRPWFWLLSAGPFGTLLILLKPNLSRATNPEERERWEQRADWAGGILSGFTLFAMFALPMIAMLGWVSYRAVGPAPPVATSNVTTRIPSDMEETEPAESPSDASPDPKPSENAESPSDQLPAKVSH